MKNSKSALSAKYARLLKNLCASLETMRAVRAETGDVLGSTLSAEIDLASKLVWALSDVASGKLEASHAQWAVAEYDAAMTDIMSADGVVASL